MDGLATCINYYYGFLSLINAIFLTSMAIMVPDLILTFYSLLYMRNINIIIISYHFFIFITNCLRDKLNTINCLIKIQGQILPLEMIFWIFFVFS
jgi:hypothetical protein